MAGFRNDVLFGQSTELTNTVNAQFSAYTDGVNTWGYFKSNGSPEGVVTADKGSICSDVVNGDIYYKTTNSANTGWSLLSGAGSTPLAQYSVALGTGVSSLSSVGPSATVGAILQSAGNAANPVFSTAAYPSTSAQGDILYSSAANTIVGLAKNTTATRYLSNTGASNNPAWAQVDLTNGVTGTLPVGSGGTGKTTFTPVNGVVIGNSTSALGVTGAGTAGQIFISNSPSAPSFASSTPADFAFTNATAATARTLTVSHADNTSASSTANYTASVGGTSAGDAWYQATVGTSRSYAWGIDNTDSQSLKITTAAAATVSPSSASVFMKITSNGEMTLPLQPGFSAYLGTTASNVTGNNTLYILGDTDVGSALTEIFDNNGDFDPGTANGALLTAPVDAKWWLCGSFFLLQANTSTGFDTNIRTSNRNYRGFYVIPSLSTSDFFAYNISVIADMDAGDTADIRVNLNGAGADTVDVYGGTDARSCFYGWQLG